MRSNLETVKEANAKCVRGELQSQRAERMNIARTFVMHVESEPRKSLGFPKVVPLVREHDIRVCVLLEFTAWPIERDACPIGNITACPSHCRSHLLRT